MSFITKRERVFNEYDLFDLPARNEGKLKAYASCTDARAWSHFCSDKSEHLVEIIKRNNDMCRPKYVPTNVIVDTLMVSKNAEIARLKRRIEEFEQMLAVYDELDLTCDQKCEIAKAHAAIKAANKELDELCLDLDLSGFTEAIDSEAFETGNSRGDEPSRNQTIETPKSKGDEWTYERGSVTDKDSKSNQVDFSCPCDASTLAVDPRIDEMQDTIIKKDAKLSAMQNTIAVMENDVCEPYCIYAHIYTALEKIFGILCQNTKYKLYLDLMTAGKDTRCIDIKGKILYKLKVLEKFSLALTAPCSQEMENSADDCACYRAEVIERVETNLALSSPETQYESVDNKRAHLVADIMENDEMKEILSKESNSANADCETDECFLEEYNMDSENLKRLKLLQESYDDLMTCYESLKHEKDCLQLRCRKYQDLEKEFEMLKCQLREYNALWKEKEHYKNRSNDLDTLKEQFLVLSDETSNLEVQLKAESKINEEKTKSIEQLNNENILLEKKLNEAFLSFEKEKNALQCKLKECECREMCQDQQIKVLSVQIDRLLEQDPNKVQEKEADLALIDEINSKKEQIKNLKDLLLGNEEEKQQLQEEYQNKLNIINDLKMEIEDWKSAYEKTLQRNEYLEKYTEDFRDEVQGLVENNNTLSREVEDKTAAIDNLHDVINNKSQEIDKLLEHMKQKSKENADLYREIQSLRELYNRNIATLDGEKTQAMSSLQLARQESQELLEKVKNYADKVHQQEDLSNSFEEAIEENQKLRSLVNSTQEKNNMLQMDLHSRDSQNSILLQEIQRLRDVNNYAANNLSSLQDERNQYKHSLEITQKESKMLGEKVNQLEDLTQQLQGLKEENNKLIQEKRLLEIDIQNKKFELDDAVQLVQLSKKESEDLVTKLQQSENTISELLLLNDAYKQILQDKENLQKDLSNKGIEFEKLKIQNDELLRQKSALQTELENKTEEINHLYNTLETKIDENRELNQRIKSLELDHRTVTNNMKSIKQENIETMSTLTALRKDSDELINKLKYYESLELKYNELKYDYQDMIREKIELQSELEKQITNLKKMQRENFDLNRQSQTLLTDNEDLENSLINARTELMKKSSSNNYHADIIKEIEELKREKLESHKKVRDLLDKIEKSEDIISYLNEEVMARDDKISILENYNNELKNEVLKLQNSLATVVETGEELTDNSYRNIEESLQSMRAHYSKATHNMKMEVAKLQNDNEKLEEQLSFNQMKASESTHEKHEYLSQVMNLQKEREIIVTDIKQLELSSVGDSVLSPDNCNVNDILNSISRIRRYLDNRSSKNTSLEQTLMKVQDSYQLVQSKADEAKRIVEKEKQKIVSEKEEAIRDKTNMEKQLFDLKKQLDTQVSNNKAIIKDLEGEISNQKLIFDKINKSTQKHISKLEEELESLKNVYQKSLESTAELENKFLSVSKKNSDNMDLIERTNKDLSEKCKEIEDLKTQLNKLKAPPREELGIQVTIPNIQRHNIESQTDKEPENKYSIKYEQDKDNTQENTDYNFVPINKPRREKHITDNDKAIHQNEVQILTASTEPSFDYVKSTYLNYKLQQLSTRSLELFSCPSKETVAIDNRELPERKNETIDNNMKVNDLNVVDIYNKKLMRTSSSKAINNNENSDEVDSNAYNIFTDYMHNNESDDSNVDSRYRIENEYQTPSVNKSDDKGLFVIYKDSEIKYGNKHNKKVPWASGHSEILVESMTVQSNIHKEKTVGRRNTDSNKHNKKQEFISDLLAEEEELEEDDSVKVKLKIDLPRVELDVQSLNNSEVDKKSLDSYTIAIYSPPKGQVNYKTKQNSPKVNRIKLESASTHSITNADDIFFDSFNSTNELKRNQNFFDKEVEQFDGSFDGQLSPKKVNADSSTKFISDAISAINDNSESHHRLARIGADVLLIKEKKNLGVNETERYQSDSPRQGNFGLDYILHSIQHQDESDNLKTMDAARALRRARSDERHDLSKIHGRTDSSPSRLSGVKNSMTDHKTFISSFTHSKSSGNSDAKTYVEKCVMAKLDKVEDYEKKIQKLTNNLENIERDYKKKIEAIKTQYDNNIKCILNEHNQGVQSIQNLHEDTLKDIIKIHENEVENLRSMSIDAMRKADKLEKENKSLKCRMQDSTSARVDEEPIRMSTPEQKRRRKCRLDPKMLTKTNVEAFNVKPKSRALGPCTCSIDVNISDTIRNIFEQVDMDQRKTAEYGYLKYIANKILNGNVEALDTQELSFLHLKVCRIWKLKLNKEESLQKKIDSLEIELMNKQRHAQQNIEELDRKVAEERRRLQCVREAVCRPPAREPPACPPPAPSPDPDRDALISINCKPRPHQVEVGERRSASDLAQFSNVPRMKRPRADSNRAVLAKLDVEERRERKTEKMYSDELPTRLRKTDRSQRPHKK